MVVLYKCVPRNPIRFRVFEESLTETLRCTHLKTKRGVKLVIQYARNPKLAVDLVVTSTEKNGFIEQQRRTAIGNFADRSNSDRCTTIVQDSLGRWPRSALSRLDCNVYILTRFEPTIPRHRISRQTTQKPVKF